MVLWCEWFARGIERYPFGFTDNKGRNVLSGLSVSGIVVCQRSWIDAVGRIAVGEAITGGCDTGHQQKTMLALTMNGSVLR